MNIIRKLSGLLLAFSLAAFAIPASAQSKAFTILTPAVPNATFGVDQTIYVDFKNVGTSSSYNSIELEALTVTGTTLDITKAEATTGKKGEFSKISPTRFTLAKLSPTGTGQTLRVKLTATLVSTSCSPASITWRGGAWTGSPTLPSSEYTFVPSPANQSTTSTETGSTSCSVRFVPAVPPSTPSKEPRSATLPSTSPAVVTSVLNDPTGAGVQAEVMINSTTKDTSFNGSITIVKTSSPTGSVIGNATATASAGIATFGNSTSATPLTLNKLGSYTLKATAGSLESSPVTILVSNATLNCAPLTGLPPADSTAGVGDWQVVRYQLKNGCTKTNYLTTLGTSSNPADANGFVLGPDFFSIVYDVPDDGVLLTHAYTSAPYAVDADTGLPPQKVVKYCKANSTSGDKDCTPTGSATLVKAKVCLTANIEGPAIPGWNTSTMEPGCLRSLGWFSVAPSVCVAAGISSTNAANGCVRFLVELLEAADPPWGLTDE